ncbi:coadhesin-like isoform X2 [Oscarella lobularis]
MQNYFFLLLLSLAVYREAAGIDPEGVCWERECGVAGNKRLSSNTFYACCFNHLGASWISSNDPCLNCSTASSSVLTSWGEWSDWKRCVNCVTKRFRVCKGLVEGDCKKGAKQTANKPCKRSRRCFAPTPSRSRWSDWINLMECSRTCGGGIIMQMRSCLRSPCHGLSFNVKKCNRKPCPVYGQWSDWSSWFPCNATCGGGIRSRQRKCLEDKCWGQENEKESCNANSCPVPGGWSEWIKGPCSRSCGRGVKNRVRHCNSPAPQHGGSYCRGHSSESKNCCNDCPNKKVTYVASYRVARYYQEPRYYTKSCGFFSWGRCKGTSYRSAVNYHYLYKTSYRMEKGLSCSK